jgi:hypothetical protein
MIVLATPAVPDDQVRCTVRCSKVALHQGSSPAGIYGMPCCLAVHGACTYLCRNLPVCSLQQSTSSIGAVMTGNRVCAQANSQAFSSRPFLLTRAGPGHLQVCTQASASSRVNHAQAVFVHIRITKHSSNYAVSPLLLLTAASSTVASARCFCRCAFITETPSAISMGTVTGPVVTAPKSQANPKIGCR